MGTFVQNVLFIFETLIFPISPGNFSTNVPNQEEKRREENFLTEIPYYRCLNAMPLVFDYPGRSHGRGRRENEYGVFEP
jgi:hypothetical protein